MVLAALAMLFAAGCGDGGGDGTGGATIGEDGEARPATLVLDFVAGPAHIGIFTALEQGFYSRAGIDLEVIEPSSTADTLGLIAAGRAEFGIADGIDVAGQIDAGRDAQALLALAQRPLGGLITRRADGYSSPAGLASGTVGVTGVPSDEALLDTEIADAGGDPSRVRRVTIGFGGVRALQGGRVDAFTGFIPADGVQVEQGGTPTRSFPFDQHGGPQYPGLVVFSGESRIEADPELMEDFIGATVHGYRLALARPELGLESLLRANPEIEPGFARAAQAAITPYFTVEGIPFGRLRPAKLRELSDFLVDTGLIEAPIPPDRYAATALSP